MVKHTAIASRRANLAAPNFYLREIAGGAQIFRRCDNLCVCRVYSMPLAKLVLESLNAGGPA